MLFLSLVSVRLEMSFKLESLTPNTGLDDEKLTCCVARWRATICLRFTCTLQNIREKIRKSNQPTNLTEREREKATNRAQPKPRRLYTTLTEQSIRENDTVTEF